MKRRVAFILLLLVGGAIVNVAVAWGCGFSDLHGFVPGPPPSPTEGGDLQWWQANVPPGFESIDEMDVLHRLFGFGREYTQWPQHSHATVSRYYIQRNRSGWPILSMEQSHWYDWVEGSAVHKHAWHLSFLDHQTPFVPLRPLWPGFAINTLFYAGILWLLFAAPFALRRRSRIKRGLCPKCAYPIGTSDVCTECGASHATMRAVRDHVGERR